MRQISLLATALMGVVCTAFHSKSPPQRCSKGYTAAWITIQTSRTSSDLDMDLARRKRKGANKTPASPPRRTPLVDSNLLRFVSAQKKARQLQRIQDEEMQQQVLQRTSRETQQKATDSPERNKFISNNEPELVASLSIDDGAALGANAFAAYLSSSLASKMNEPTDSDDYMFMETFSGQTDTAGDTTSDQNWLGQFNSNRVARVLMSHTEVGDAKELETLAITAGDRVQSQALARTARRRVREFLKQRDRIWLVDGVEEVNVPVDDFPVGIPSEPRTLQNNFENVVDLMLEYGLSVRDIAEILIHSPGIALMQARPIENEAESETDAASSSEGETLKETLNRVLVDLLCGTLGLRRYEARKVLRRTPGLLTMRGSRSAMEMVALFVQLSVSAKSLARNQGNQLPVLLSRSPASVFRLIAFLASDAVRMPVESIGPLLRRPGCQELLDTVAPVPRLETQNRLEKTAINLADNSTLFGAEIAGYSDKESSLFEDSNADPSVLSALYGRGSQTRRERINRTYQKMSETAWTLRNKIGTSDLGKVIAAYPSVLLLDAKEQILPTAKYLMEDLGMWEDDLPRVLQLYPLLLGKPREEMQRVVDYLKNLGVDEESMPLIFRSFPAILTMDIETQIKPVEQFLRETVGIRNIGRFVTRLPPVLGYSVKQELRPKWEFLKAVTTDPRFEVSRFPAYFSYPLDRVIKSRFMYLVRIKRIPVALLPRLDNVLRHGDRDFAIKIARDRDDGAAFLAFAKPSQNEKIMQNGNKE
ncbi:mTERF domain-containing protein, mitochondrial [Fistulifera solaris]|uniref:mTERF domain-containing protein, mitochondrial n=1 Tax=Fistulifera solaris TaxID=1519565 RepID=A0A1Z5JB37_FISSO|nr:mTERF domain-containing protein, mitochondrial [Fistulifera solaris]|eukprot:GAX10981.1 mTERF domain-containing protein, mitochondrial [Fistulifera solaris]